MGRYIKWNEVVARYPIAGTIGGSEVTNDEFVKPAEFELDSRLSRAYTAPFSSNNETAKDLSIDIAYYRMTLTNKAIDSESLKESIADRINSLLEGESNMITTSGDLLSSDVAQAWSNNKDYRPTFDMGPTIEQSVDSSYLQDISDAKI